MIAFVVLMLAAAPDAEFIGSVDGPFLWGDARASFDSTQYESGQAPLPGQVASGVSVLAQGQLFGGWGLPVLGRRLTLAAAFTGTGVVTDRYLVEFPNVSPRFDPAPLMLAGSMPFLVDRVVFVPILGVTLPTRDAFFVDPILALQPQLRLRARFDALVVGLAAFANVPVITAWAPTDWMEHTSTRRCPPDETLCRMPVARELWRLGASAQVEYWALPSLSGGARLALEGRNEDLARFVISPDGDSTIPRWLTLEVRAHAFINWAFSDHFGLTLTGGLAHERRDSGITGTSWDAALSLWFRTDPRLNRFWLDR